MPNDYAVLDAGWRVWYSGVHGMDTINGCRPDDYVEIEIWREEWDESSLVDPRAMDRHMNVYGLWWRPSGPLR